jgi:hypothetical protein
LIWTKQHPLIPDNTGISSSIVVLLERTQRGGTFRHHAKDSERVRQQGFGASLRQA